MFFHQRILVKSIHNYHRVNTRPNYAQQLMKRLGIKINQIAFHNKLTLIGICAVSGNIKRISNSSLSDGFNSFKEFLMIVVNLVKLMLFKKNFKLYFIA